MYPIPRTPSAPPRPGLEQYRSRRRISSKPAGRAIPKPSESGRIGARRASRGCSRRRSGAGSASDPGPRGPGRGVAKSRLSSAKAGRPNAKCGVTQAQFVIARAHGFRSWPKLEMHIESLAQRGSSVARFERAADAIVAGDEAALKRLLKEDPELVRARSTREHGATLLHYVSANGVEGYRQKTPKNIVRIAEILLPAGADVDAEAEVYGGGATTLGSPRRAPSRGCGSADPAPRGSSRSRGADRSPRGAGTSSRPSWGASPTAVIRRPSSLPAAVPGWISRARRASGGSTWSGAFSASAAAGNPGSTEATGRPRCAGLAGTGDKAWRSSCWSGRRSRRPGRRGDDRAAHGRDSAGALEMVRLLLKRKPPLEVVNRYGGTVLGQATWSAAHGGDPEAYARSLEALDRRRGEASRPASADQRANRRDPPAPRQPGGQEPVVVRGEAAEKVTGRREGACSPGCFNPGSIE
jgi:hypothetical protein